MSCSEHSRAKVQLRTFSDYRNIHLSGTIIVCGCGESLNMLEHPERYVTIGVNDVGRRFSPDYLVVINPRSQFSGDRFSYVERSTARTLFTQLPDLAVPHPNIIHFRLGQYGGTDLSDPNVLHYTQNSPYVALCLAAHMGASRIGLIGVDFTENHFFGQTGTHPLASGLSTINEQYRRLGEALQKPDIEVVNLSSASRLTAFPKMTMREFNASTAIAGTSKELPLKIVSYATTPIAGVPLALADCINARTVHQAHCVWATNDYGNGVRFESAIEWTHRAEEAESRLREADLVIVHNGKVEPRHAPLFEGRPIVTMAHNYMWNVDRGFFEKGWPGLVVGQYQATLPEFSDWHVVPNPVPFWKPAYSPESKPDVITICYTPSGTHERYPPEHRLYWHGKGYETTMRVLDRLSHRGDIRIETIRGNQVSHAESLAMKRRAHVVIDECVTGSYHRNSLEGLACGCVVVNGVGLVPGVVDALRRCAPGTATVPFVQASLDNLEPVLSNLIESGPEALAARGAENRSWLEQNWDFARQWTLQWEPVVRRAQIVAGDARTPPLPEQQKAGEHAAPSVTTTRQFQQGVSVVIPHGGVERLSHLGASLANLAQAAGVSEVIVVEMGAQPGADRLARRWGAKYVFIHNPDAFERARALNTGAALAEFDLVLWKDNDLVLPESFISIAAAELRSRNLDHLLPYEAIHYLTESDSRGIIAGTIAPVNCKPARVLYGGRDVSGGAALVKSDFLCRFGGIPEMFRGWGGEDNAWMHKASLFGRTGVTQRTGQYLFHLHHPDSGAFAGKPLENNPYYVENVTRLEQLRAINDAQEYLQRFPDTGRRVCPWDQRQHIVVLYDDPLPVEVEAMIDALEDLYGIRCDRLKAQHNGSVEPKLADAAAVIATQDLLCKLRRNIFLESVWKRTVALITQNVHSSFDGSGAAIPCGNVVEERAGVREVVISNNRSPVSDCATLAQSLSLVIAGYGGCTDEKNTDYQLENQDICRVLGNGHDTVSTVSMRQTVPSSYSTPHTGSARKFQNIFACLVHESRECVVDLVRNLRYHDPDSVILLYNGGQDTKLLSSQFPFEHYGAIVHPTPRRLTWGRLHEFALHSMQFALDHFAFDTITIVDSDQLAIRSGYSQYLGKFLAGQSCVGMLGNAPAPQAPNTQISPAAKAWNEIELWRPLLQRFSSGQEKFLYWTFWPSTVFAADAARDLTRFFKQDEQLNEIVRKSQIWATEEVILPTIVALLGYRIAENPCSYDFVKFRAKYVCEEIACAFEKSDVFWVHPITRRYNDPLRKYVRARCNDYIIRIPSSGEKMEDERAKSNRDLLLTMPILKQMRGIEGWLDEEEADLLIATLGRALTELAASAKIVEVGSYCGRSTVVLGSVVKRLMKTAKIYAIDPHDGVVGAADQNLEQVGHTFEKFSRNIAQAGLTDLVEVIRNRSFEVDWHDPIRFLFIDGLHDYTNVATDFYHFEPTVLEGGYVAFHDYAEYYPGVKTFVNELFATGQYEWIECVRSMVVLRKRLRDKQTETRKLQGADVNVTPPLEG